MKNQVYVESLQNLVMRMETLKTFQPQIIEEVIDVLRNSPQLQTTKTEKLLQSLPTQKNWINLKYNIIDDLVVKIGDLIQD